MPMPRCSGVSPLTASSNGPCWVVGRKRQPSSKMFPRLVGAGQGESAGSLGNTVSMILPSQAPAVSCSHFPLCALCRGVVQEMQRHRNQSRGRCRILLSTSQPLASTPSFAAVIVPCDLASVTMGHSLQAIKPDNKKG